MAKNYTDIFSSALLHLEFSKKLNMLKTIKSKEKLVNTSVLSWLNFTG